MFDEGYHEYIRFWESHLENLTEDFVYNLLVTDTGEMVSYFS